MVPFERTLSKFSESQKIIEIGSTEFKLWQLKDCTILRLRELNIIISTAINFSTVDLIILKNFMIP